MRSLLIALLAAMMLLPTSACKQKQLPDVVDWRQAGTEEENRLMEQVLKQDPAAQMEFISTLPPDQQQALMKRMQEAPAILEVSPRTAMPGDEVEVFGMIGEGKEARIVLTGKNFAVIPEIKKREDMQLVFQVPYDLPGGALLVDMQRKMPDGKWMKAINPVPCWVSSNQNEIAAGRAGNIPSLKPGQTAIGYFRNNGDRNAYRIDLPGGAFSFEAEGVVMDDMEVRPSPDGTPIFSIRFNTGGGTNVVIEREAGQKDFKIDLPKHERTILEVEGYNPGYDGTATEADYKKGLGFYRIHLK